jgi:hypothetical protein
MAILYRGDEPLGPDAAYRACRAMASHDALLVASPGPWTAAETIAWGPARYATTFRALWDASALVVRFDATDDAPWHRCTARDDRLWEEEVVELFVDPAGTGRDYAEVEISPANVLCDLRVRTPWPELSSDREWDWHGLTSRVVSRPDGCWTAVAVLPWIGLPSLSAAAATRVPPRPGDRWRFNVFRIKRPCGPADPERDAVYAAWSVPGGPSFHVPEAFRDLVFVEGGNVPH